MLAPWLNYQVTVTRRAAVPARNSLNEPGYGAESSWPAVYTNLAVRIEYPDLQMEFTETGERIKLPQSSVSGVDMYVEPQYTIKPEDRVTVTVASDASLVGQLYIATAVYPENDSMGNVHHFVCELQIH